MSYWKKLVKDLTDDSTLGIEFLLMSNLAAFVILFILIIIYGVFGA